MTWVIWNIKDGHHCLRTSLEDTFAWTHDLDAGLSFPTFKEAQVAATPAPGFTGGGSVAERAWVQELELWWQSLNGPSPKAAPWPRPTGGPEGPK